MSSQVEFVEKYYWQIRFFAYHPAESYEHFVYFKKSLGFTTFFGGTLILLFGFLLAVFSDSQAVSLTTGFITNIHESVSIRYNFLSEGSYFYQYLYLASVISLAPLGIFSYSRLWAHYRRTVLHETTRTQLTALSAVGVPIAVTVSAFLVFEVFLADIAPSGSQSSLTQIGYKSLAFPFFASAVTFLSSAFLINIQALVVKIFKRGS